MPVARGAGHRRRRREATRPLERPTAFDAPAVGVWALVFFFGILRNRRGSRGGHRGNGFSLAFAGKRNGLEFVGPEGGDLGEDGGLDTLGPVKGFGEDGAGDGRELVEHGPRGRLCTVLLEEERDDICVAPGSSMDESRPLLRVDIVDGSAQCVCRLGHQRRQLLRSQQLVRPPVLHPLRRPRLAPQPVRRRPPQRRAHGDAWAPSRADTRLTRPSSLVRRAAERAAREA